MFTARLVSIIRSKNHTWYINYLRACVAGHRVEDDHPQSRGGTGGYLNTSKIMFEKWNIEKTSKHQMLPRWRFRVALLTVSCWFLRRFRASPLTGSFYADVSCFLADVFLLQCWRFSVFLVTVSVAVLTVSCYRANGFMLACWRFHVFLLTVLN